MDAGTHQTHFSRTGGSTTEGLDAWLTRSRPWLLPLLLAVAGVARLARWDAVAVLFNDGPAFLEVAEAFRRGDFALGLSHPYHPGYSLLIAGFMPLFGSAEAAAVAVSVMGGVLSVFALHALVSRAFGPAPALIAAGLLAVNPAAIMYSGDVQSDGLYLGLFLSAAGVLYRGLDAPARTAAWAIAGGAAIGIAYLVRPEALGLSVVAAVVLAIRWLKQDWSFVRCVVYGVCLWIGVGLVAAPYLVFLRMDSGTWALSQKKSVGAMVGTEAVPDQGPALDMPAPEAAAPVPESQPTQASREAPPAASAARPSPEPAPEASPPPVRKDRENATGQPALVALGDVLRTHFRALRYEVIAFLLAAAWWVRRPWSRGDAFVAAAIGVYFLVLYALAYRYGYVSGRHALPSMVLTMGWAASGMLAFAAWVGRRRSRAAPWALALCVAVIASIGLSKALRPDRLDALAERRAAEWLSDQEVEGATVAARKRRTAYYASSAHIRIPTAARLDDLARRGASHLILSRDDLKKYPALARQLPEQGRAIHRVEAGGDVAEVYLLGPGPAASARP